MAKNSADVLHDFFSIESNLAARRQYSLIGLAVHLDHITSILETWRSMGRVKDADTFESAVGRWTQSVYESWGGALGLNINGFPKPAEGDMGLLLLLSDKLDVFEPAFETEQLESVSKFVADVRTALAEDTTLSEELRLHIATLIIEVERCIAEYQITGDFELGAAIERLMANLLIAEHSTKKPGVWQKVYDKWFQPIAVGLIVNAPLITLALAPYVTGTIPTQ